MALAPNPNPARITAELWWFWLQFHALEPGAMLAGFYAAKAGYHNTRNANHRKDYSVLSLIDRAGPGDKASAIDITFPDAQRGQYRTIAKYSLRLLLSGRDLNDERGNYLREFYGNADMDAEVEGWDFQRVGPATSDKSHLWHLHISFSRGHVANLKAMRAVLSILTGEPVKTWRAKESARLLPPPKKAVPPKPPVKKAAPPPPKLTTPPARVVKPIVTAPLPPMPPQAVRPAAPVPITKPDTDDRIADLPPLPLPPQGGGPFGDELPPVAPARAAPGPARRGLLVWLREFLARSTRRP